MKPQVEVASQFTAPFVASNRGKPLVHGHLVQLGAAVNVVGNQLERKLGGASRSDLQRTGCFVDKFFVLRTNEK